MGKESNVDTKIELCAGNEILAPNVRTFKAMRQYHTKNPIFQEVTDTNKTHIYHMMGGRDTCKVSAGDYPG